MAELKERPRSTRASLSRQRVIARRRAIRRRRVTVVVALAVAGVSIGLALSSSSPPANRQTGPASGPVLSPLRARIVAIARSQLGYRTDPPDSYCNKYSAHFYSGTTDCPGDLRQEEWCADFAAWVWQRAGAEVVYQYLNGDLNSSSASFYEWGVRTGTWHPASSGYRPRPGDVAVYGLKPGELYAAHVAIVVAAPRSARGPTAINGDGDLTGFSVVELEHDEYRADVHGRGPPLSGYVSPVSA